MSRGNPFILSLLVLLVGFLVAAEARAQDADGDGVLDPDDNCLNIPNSNQHNSDGDPFGNMCDADYDQSGFVAIADLNTFLLNVGPFPADPSTDCCDDTPGPNVCGVVNLRDFFSPGCFFFTFLGPPGP